MKLRLEWARPVPLRDGARIHQIYDIDLNKIPATQGVYIFGRQRKDRTRNFEALYVGRATVIRRRIKNHLQNNTRLMLRIKDAKQGQKVVLTARFAAQRGQGHRSLSLIEQALIRYFLSEGHDLMNKQGTKLRQHEISSEGQFPKRFIPKVMFLEKARGV